ncbi:MAG: hypothetical protein ABFD86_20895, partial [Bryobacteraceae bacterium]
QDLLVHITRPMFVFFRINWNKYRRAGLGFEHVPHSHQLIVDYIEGNTNLSAQECFLQSLHGGALQLEGAQVPPVPTMVTT